MITETCVCGATIQTTEAIAWRRISDWRKEHRHEPGVWRRWCDTHDHEMVNRGVCWVGYLYEFPPGGDCTCHGERLVVKKPRTEAEAAGDHVVDHFGESLRKLAE